MRTRSALSSLAAAARPIERILGIPVVIITPGITVTDVAQVPVALVYEAKVSTR